MADLIAAPRSRWVLAWLAARSGARGPADRFDAVDTRPHATRAAQLRHDAARLLTELHERLDNWPYRLADQQAAAAYPADALQRIAAYLATAPAARWWWSALDRRSQTWISEDPAVTHTKIPHVTNYANRFDQTAPAAAVTTSTRLPPALPASRLLWDYGASYARRPSSADLRAWDLKVKPDARVYEIHSPRDWVALVDRYVSHRPDAALNLHVERAWPAQRVKAVLTVDWRAMAQDYDGVHMSVAGWLTAMSHVLEVPDKGYTVCEGWPSESTMWFRPVFDSWTQLQAGPLEYGYGRPSTGCTVTPRVRTPRWRSWLRSLSISR